MFECFFFFAVQDLLGSQHGFRVEYFDAQFSANPLAKLWTWHVLVGWPRLLPIPLALGRKKDTSSLWDSSNLPFLAPCVRRYKGLPNLRSMVLPACYNWQQNVRVSFIESPCCIRPFNWRCWELILAKSAVRPFYYVVKGQIKRLLVREVFLLLGSSARASWPLWKNFWKLSIYCARYLLFLESEPLGFQAFVGADARKWRFAKNNCEEAVALLGRQELSFLCCYETPASVLSNL